MKSRRECTHSLPLSFHQQVANFGKCSNHQERGFHVSNNAVHKARECGRNTAAAFYHQNESSLKEIEVVQHLFNFALLIFRGKMELYNGDTENFDGKINLEPFL